MNVLILVNGAPAHRPFFERVGALLERDGHTVFFAADSRFSEYLYPDAPLPASRTHVFSDYFKKNRETACLPHDLADLNLWTAMYPDLDRANYATLMFRRRKGYYERLLVNLVAFFDEIIQNNRIDCVVYETVSNSFAYVAMLVAGRRGARYVGFASSRLPGRVDVTDGRYFRHTRTEDVFWKIRRGEMLVPSAVRSAALDYCDNIDKKKPDYVVSNNSLSRSPLYRYLRAGPARNYARAVRYYLQHRDEYEWAFQLANPLTVYPEVFGRELARWSKARYLVRYYVAPEAGEKFFIYPMQYHPESSGSVDGPYFNDELANIRNVSLNLPFGIVLYVRDHPYAFAQAPLSFYRAIKRLPNVRLIDHRLDGKSLVRKCAAVVTNTSTMGFEAIVLGKPVFVLGHPFYDFHPLVRRLDTWNSAFDELRRYSEIKASKAEIEAMVQAYFLSSFPGTYDLRAHWDDETASTFARVILLECEGGASFPSDAVERKLPQGSHAAHG